ncbi:hypothetical protein GIB67_022998 [Kingdonia uniflora]|uniref:Uncharacterized protein n=1 Tax=Kingdonia uniflora TaxID=39325 RepID=A0A7J7P2G0_9MAGN|nr:hypothetical protein GIB67_022998 [Kingdonia uniflora]
MGGGESSQEVPPLDVPELLVYFVKQTSPLIDQLSFKRVVAGAHTLFLFCRSSKFRSRDVGIIPARYTSSRFGQTTRLNSWKTHDSGDSGCRILQVIYKRQNLMSNIQYGSIRKSMVQQTVNERSGKCLLELSGNNAIIIMDDADIKLAVRSISLLLLVPWFGVTTNHSTSPFVEDMYEKIKDFLIEYEVVINRWPQYSLILENLGIFLNTIKRVLDVLHCRVDDIFKPWASCVPLTEDKKSVLGEQLNGITILLRTKYKNYMQATVEKLCMEHMATGRGNALGGLQTAQWMDVGILKGYTLPKLK